jgi:nucleotide-binding universal stress UspA family protein
MKTIVCPTDFSKISTQAIEYASAIGNDFKSEVILLHVYEAPTLYSDLPMEAIRNQEEDYKTNAKDKLEKLVLKLKKKYKDVNFETHLIEGERALEINSFAKKRNADMIVIGKTSESKIKRLLLGSTAAAIIGKSDCPVLCIPPDNEFKQIKKIVFATDLHEDNIGSAHSITSFAAHFNAEIIFVFVDDEHMIHSDEKINEMTQKIKKRIKYPKMSGYISKSTSISKGIEYFLEKNKADLLVMFTHSRHFPGSVFNQSVTKIISYKTKIPLLALKISESPIMDKF